MKVKKTMEEVLKEQNKKQLSIYDVMYPDRDRSIFNFKTTNKERDLKWPK